MPKYGPLDELNALRKQSFEEYGVSERSLISKLSAVNLLLLSHALDDV